MTDLPGEQLEVVEAGEARCSLLGNAYRHFGFRLYPSSDRRLPELVAVRAYG